MSRVTGQMLTCDRCGAQRFVKALDPKSLDGGFTRVEQYEKADGWEIASGLCKLLCPGCNSEWNRIMRNFMPTVTKEEGENA